MVDLRDIINQKYLGLQFHNDEFPRKEDVADLLEEGSNCLSIKGYENTQSNTGSSDLEENDDTVIFFDNIDETDDIAEGCRKNLFKHTSSWMKTELLLLKLQEANLSDTEPHESRADFVNETENGGSEVDSDWSFQNMQPTEIVRSRNFQSSLKISEVLVPKAWVFENPGESLHNQSSRFSEFETVKNLRKQIQNYRTLFLHLVNDVIIPCDDKIRGLIKEILGIRRDEGELISLGSGTCNEMSIISENLRDNTTNDGVYWQKRLSRCTNSVQDMCTKLEKTQNELALLETWFSVRSTRITDTITRIRFMRNQVLEEFHRFYQRNSCHEIFRSKDIHKWCYVTVYQKRTIWYSEVNVEEFKHTLSQNLKALVISNESIDQMMKRMHEYLAEVNDYIGSQVWKDQNEGTLKIKSDTTFNGSQYEFQDDTEKKYATTEGTPTENSKIKRKRNRPFKTKRTKKRSSTKFA